MVFLLEKVAIKEQSDPHGIAENGLDAEPALAAICGTSNLSIVEVVALGSDIVLQL
jgi:hypothetical protein